MALAVQLPDLCSASVLDCLTPNNDGEGYGQFAWVGMSADLNSSNGGVLATTSDLSNLAQLMTYTGLWVDVRQPDTGTLTTTEASNLQSFIASGRRVVLIGGPGPQGTNPAYSSWNDSILSAAGGPTGTTYFTSSSIPAYPTSPVTIGVSAIAVPAGAYAASGATMFASRVATVWGPDRNAIVLLDTGTLDDDNLKKASDSVFAANLASWVAGGETDGACDWESSTGGGWQAATNWQLSEPPSVADDAVFNLGAAGYTVSVVGPTTARNLIVQNDRVTVNLSTGSSNLVLCGGISVAANSSLAITGGSVTATGVQAAGSVSIANGHLLIAASATHGSLDTIHSLTLTGTLDLADTDLDLQTGSLSAVTAEIQSAYAAGSWTGAGITSSAAAADPTHLTTLGVILNGTTYGTAAGSLGTFDGTNPAATDLLIKYTYYGDANLDGQVDGSDYTRIDSGFDDHLTGWANGDFNYDGVVDGSDYTLIDNAFNAQGANLNAGVRTASTTATIATTAVPEPASGGICGSLAGTFVSRRRRRARRGCEALKIR